MRTVWSCGLDDELMALVVEQILYNLRTCFLGLKWRL
jgi:hypothetical protein